MHPNFEHSPFEQGGPHPGSRHHHPRGGRPMRGDGPPADGMPGRRGGRGRGRGRAHRGDVRAAVLQLLAEEPMHGYQLMQAIAERSGGRWTPSPGAIYPTINQLEDEGLVVVTADAGRKLVTLTDAGREHIEARRESASDPFAGMTESVPGTDLRGLLEQLHMAARQVGRTANDTQLAAAGAILAEARRALYLLLAEGPDSPTDA
jgi:DNA-binding PadR family transcriptional regulator